MKVGELVRKDATLLPPLPKNASAAQEAAYAGRRAFLIRRGRAALVANASWKGLPADDVKPASVAALTGILGPEVGAAATRVATLVTAMADPSRTALVPIDDASVDPKGRFRIRYLTLLGRTPEQLRDTAIVTAGWAEVARDPAIPDASLHQLVSRRLRAVERMLWYVGRAGGRRWERTAGNEWRDGWNRIFEYPRLPPSKIFDPRCNRVGAGACDATRVMAGWSRTAAGRFNHDFRAAVGVRAQWPLSSTEYYLLPFRGSAGDDPVAAVRGLFTASARFDERNLLMCDHTIHVICLEALLEARSKALANTTWFSTMVGGRPAGWLRIYASFVPGAFLGSEDEDVLFDVVKTSTDDLEVGDHVIVYNHPAYDRAKESSDVWRLENAMVVTAHPRLLLQGHGTNPIPFSAERKVPVKATRKPAGSATPVKKRWEPAMRLDMLGLFNSRLDELRAAAVAENAAAAARAEIPGLDMEAALVQRTFVGPHSGWNPADYTPAALALARWWVRWDLGGKREGQIASDPAWAKQIWQKMGVELAAARGWFPLWVPTRNRAGTVVKKGGKIAAVTKIWVNQTMAPGWDWYYDRDEPVTGPRSVAVRRPTMV